MQWSGVLRVGFASVVGWIAGAVMAYEGLVPVRYSGGLMAGVLVAAAVAGLARFVRVSEETALRLAVGSCLVALIVGFVLAGLRLAGDDTDPLLALTEHARRGVVHGFREGHRSTALNAYPRRGIWVWICWSGQTLLLFGAGVVGTLAAVAPRDSHESLTD